MPTTWAGDRAFYSPASDKITMPARDKFSSAAGLYATWAHEQAHSTGHSSRLARDFSGGFGSTTYAREELVAELAAFLICNRLQIPSMHREPRRLPGPLGKRAQGRPQGAVQSAERCHQGQQRDLWS